MHLCVVQGGRAHLRRAHVYTRASLSARANGSRASLLARANGRARAQSEGALLHNVNECALVHRRCRRSTPKAVHSCAMEMWAFDPKRCRRWSLDVCLLCTHGCIAHVCVSKSSIDTGERPCALARALTLELTPR